MALADYLVPIDHDHMPRIAGCNPCDTCSYPICACPWLSKGERVDGWKAERCAIPSWPRPIQTYRILYCPLYRPPKPRKHIVPRPGWKEE